MLPFLPKVHRQRQETIKREVTDSWKPLTPCTREGLDKEIHDHKDGVLAYVSHVGCPGCLPTGQEIITSEGLRPIESVKIGDLVLTHMGRFRSVSKTTQHEHQGDLVKIKTWNNYTPSITTLDHPFLMIRNEVLSSQSKTQQLVWASAEELKEGDTLVLPRIGAEILPDKLSNTFIFSQTTNKHSEKRIWDKELVRYVYPLGTTMMKISTEKKQIEEIPITIDLMTVIGYYLAEGYPSQKGRHIAFTFGKNLLEYARAFEVKNCLENMGLSASVKADAGGCVTYAWSMKLIRIIEKEFGRYSYGKKIPKWVLELPHEYLEALFEAYINGDGSRSHQGRYISSNTVSRQLAHSLQLIGIKLGYLVGISRWDAERKSSMIMGRKVNSRDTYILSFVRPLMSGGWSGGRSDIDSTYQYMRIKQVTREPFSGLVHNLEVEEDSSYCTVAHVVHNCELMGAELEKKVAGKVPIVELPVENRSCDGLLDHLKVDSTPYLFYYKGSQEPVKTIVGYEETTPKELETLVG